MAKALDILIYGPIGAGGVDAADVVSQLSTTKAKLVNVRINSGGGSAFDGMAMYTALKHWKGDVHVHVDGLAASAASVVAMAGDVINIAEGGMIMIHSASTGLQGNADDMRKQVDVLDKLDGQMAGIYASRTGKERDDVLALMAEETWFTAEEAVAAGLADNVVGAVKVAACADLEAYGYRNAPADLIGSSIAADLTRSLPYSAEDMEQARQLIDKLAPQTTTAPVSAPGEYNEMHIFAEAAGLKDGATEAEIVAKLQNTSTALKVALQAAADSGDALGKLTAAVGAEGAEALGKIEAGKVALGLVAEQTARLEAIEAKTELDAHAALVASGKAEGKLTADLEALFADKSSAELGAFLAVAPKVVPVKDEKKSVSTGVVVGALNHNGKIYAEMNSAERLVIADEQPELFKAMSDDYRANLNAAK